MKFSYKFSNLYGTVYGGGDLLFTPDGNTVISPVGNKISMFDIKNHKSETLPIEARYSYTAIDLSPNGVSLLAVDSDGEVHLISLISCTVLHKLRTHRTVNAIKFSPDSKCFALTKDNIALVYAAPGPFSREYGTFRMLRVLKGAYDETTSISWADNSKLLAIGSKDMSVRIYALEKYTNFQVCCLGGMSDPVVGCFFESSSLDCYSVSRGGQLAVWESSIEVNDLETQKDQKEKKKRDKEEDEDIGDDTDKAEELTANDSTTEQSKMVYRRSARHFLKDHLENEGRGRGVELSCADYHKETKVLVVGFNSGSFLLLSLPDCSLIHSLGVSEGSLESVTFNPSGDWLALGCPSLGQLLVWEWQSETYVLKQQGHAGLGGMACLAHSPDGAFLATGGEDSKLKLWNTSTGFCFVTFNEHEAAISGIVFTPSGKVVLSSSMDGTVRAFDMKRYRNFKTLTTPRPVQLSCVTVDSSGDLVAAGGIDVFETYVWSLQTGRLTEVLSGHEGPVGGVAFSPSVSSSCLASVSWDGTLRLWECLTSSSASREAIMLGSEGLSLAWRPDGQAVSVATIQGQIVTFSAVTGQQTGTIHGKKDLGAGKADTDKISAKKKREAAHFSSLCYSADGSVILAGGQSKNICIYHVEEGLLLRKYEVTQNRSFQGMDETLNRRKMMAGTLGVEGREGGTQLKLAGSKAVDLSSRNIQPEVRVRGLQFSPTGRAFSAVSSEGLLVYSADRRLTFSPVELDTDLTPQRVIRELTNTNYSAALSMALRLGEKLLLRQVLETTPHTHINLITRQIGYKQLPSLLQMLAEEAESSRHLQFYLIWIKSLLSNHGTYLKSESKEFLPLFNLLIKNLTQKSEDLRKVCDHNKYTIKYILALSESKKRNKEDDSSETMEDDDMRDKVMEAVSDSDSDVDMSELTSKWSEDDEDEGEE